MTLKKLPIGIQTFENLIVEGYCYVDKTPFVDHLASKGKYYFLSRPRRFGKSLFLSTIKAAYQGKKELFRGLHLEHHWDWDGVHPVVHVSFGSGMARNIAELKSTFWYALRENARQYDITYTYSQDELKNCFAELIQALHDKYGRKVVVLVDEYDKPILDNIENPEMAATIRDELKNYYSVIKDADPYLQLVFITGVSKFSKVSLFSGLNNLKDITLDGRYSTLCGYTQAELETVFADYLHGTDLEQVRLWYNGYNWLGEEVYNPFDILLYLDSRDFRPYWFETGTPTFLVRLLQSGRYNIARIENLSAGEEIVGSFEVGEITAETLLFQAGYLTIRGFSQIGAFRNYRLGYPNMEVKASLNNAILSELVQDRLAKTRNQASLLDILAGDDPEGLQPLFHSFFASIPHDWYRKNKISGYEGYYSSIFYCYFAALGLDVVPEDTTNHGRLDLSVRFENRVFIFEFKIMKKSDQPGPALDQIKRKRYGEKYKKPGTTVYLIGVGFDPEDRNISRFEWEMG